MGTASLLPPPSPLSLDQYFPHWLPLVYVAALSAAAGALLALRNLVAAINKPLAAALLTAIGVALVLQRIAAVAPAANARSNRYGVYGHTWQATCIPTHYDAPLSIRHPSGWCLSTAL